jgi:hypothetical protein
MTDLPSPERQKALLDDWFASVHYDEAVDWREAGVDEDDDEAVVAALTRKRDGDGDGFVDDGLPTMRPVIPGFDLVPKQRFAPGFKGQQRLAPKAPAPTAPVRPWGNGPLTDAFEATIADWDTDTKSWRGFHSFNARRYEDNLWQMFTDPKYRALKPEVFAGQVAALDMIDVSMGLPPSAPAGSLRVRWPTGCAATCPTIRSPRWTSSPPASTMRWRTPTLTTHRGPPRCGRSTPTCSPSCACGTPPTPTRHRRSPPTSATRSPQGTTRCSQAT